MVWGRPVFVSAVQIDRRDRIRCAERRCRCFGGYNAGTRIEGMFRCPGYCVRRLQSRQILLAERQGGTDNVFYRDRYLLRAVQRLPRNEAVKNRGTAAMSVVKKTPEKKRERVVSGWISRSNCALREPDEMERSNPGGDGIRRTLHGFPRSLYHSFYQYYFP